MGPRRGAFALAISGLLATAAQASDKRDFETCDGRIHPGRQADGMRGTPSDPYGHLQLGTGGDVIGACTRALASPRLRPTQTLRRAHLLRARAAAHLRASDTASALGDLDLAEAAIGAAADPFHQRSMGVSLQLLRGLALAQAGDMDSAARLARSAATLRPYSLQVQHVAATILTATRESGDSDPSPWLATGRLDPDARTMALIGEAEAGNFAGMLTLHGGVGPDWPIERLQPVSLLARDESQRLLLPLLVSLDVAYARAATGDPAGARRDLLDLRGRLAAALPDAAPDAGPMAGVHAALNQFVDMRARRIEARIAVVEGRTPDAIAALVGAQMPRDASTVELMAALRAAVPATDAALVPQPAAFTQDAAATRRERLAAVVPNALIVPETPRAIVDYERARPNILGALIGGALSMGTSLLGGIERTDGFRSTENPDGTIKVEFIGNTPSPALVQEMTLLRAAEVAIAAGKPAFVIVGRQDYSRRMTTTRNGMPISSVATGFKTELTIRCMDAGTDPARALDATAIIDALGPLYYEDARPRT